MGNNNVQYQNRVEFQSKNNVGSKKPLIRTKEVTNTQGKRWKLKVRKCQMERGKKNLQGLERNERKLFVNVGMKLNM